MRSTASISGMVSRCQAFVLLAAMVGAAEATEVPIYCSTVEAAMQIISFQPALQDLEVKAVFEAPVVGPVNLSLSRIEFGNISVVKCDAEATDAVLDIDVDKLAVELKSFRFTYAQQRWPHMANVANATGDLSASLVIDVDTAALTEKDVRVTVDSLNLQLDSDKNKWLYDAAIWLGNHARPIIALAVQHELRSVMAQQLQSIKKEGSCATVNHLLKFSDAMHLEVNSVNPVTAHVPMIGDVDIFVNASNIVLPRSMSCGPWRFNGTYLDMFFDDASFSLDFEWRYVAKSQGFLHNQGTGSMKANAGVKMAVDLLRPSNADIHVHLPELDLSVRAAANDWLYRALNAVFRPVVRKGVEAFGGMVIKHELTCLADPSCHALGSAAHVESAVVEASVDVPTEARTSEIIV